MIQTWVLYSVPNISLTGMHFFLCKHFWNGGVSSHPILLSVRIGTTQTEGTTHGSCFPVDDLSCESRRSFLRFAKAICLCQRSGTLLFKTPSLSSDKPFSSTASRSVTESGWVDRLPLWTHVAVCGFGGAAGLECSWLTGYAPWHGGLRRADTLCATAGAGAAADRPRRSV